MPDPMDPNSMLNPMSPHPDVDPMAVSMAVSAGPTDPNSWTAEDSLGATDIPPVTPEMNPYFVKDMMESRGSMGGMSPQMGGMPGMAPPESDIPEEMSQDDADMMAQMLNSRMAQENSDADQFQDSVASENEQQDNERMKRGF